MRAIISVFVALCTGLAHVTKPSNLPPPSTHGALTGLKYTNVGGSGSYQMVTSMPPGTWPKCDVSPSCTKQARKSSGNLAPFNEDITVVFRGPMNLKHIAVYQPSDGTPGAASWIRKSAWSTGNSGNNLVFMNNKGGQISGEWSICHGASQSYANAGFTDAAKSPGVATPGSIPAGQETNIMTSTACTKTSGCEGFYRGTAHKGWSGSKLFVFEFNMPSSDASHPPAIWALNSQVVRSAQYGCNCRGMGAQGGCGEIDLLEVLPGGGATAQHAISQIYSFKTSTGSGNDNWFNRPTSGLVTYMAIFDVKSDQILIQRLTSFDWNTNSFSRGLIDEYLASPAKIVSMKTNGLADFDNQGSVQSPFRE